MPTLPTTQLQYDRGQLSDAQLLTLYEQLLRPRLIEEKMLKLLRQGKVSKWFAGIGQEAISVGAAAALRPDEYLFTMHRNLGVFTTREVPLDRLFGQWQGKATGFTKGRDRSFHFGAPEYHIVGMISHLGPQLSLAAGVALAHKISGAGRVSLAFTGEGGTSQGEFHEALNTAAVWQLPVIFVVENNGYGLSTPTEEQYRCASLADRGVGYGMRSLSIDGNNILEVYRTISELAAELREQPEPVLLECRTFRMRGHEEASGTKYVPDELMNAWAEKDPLQNFEDYLREEGILTPGKISYRKDKINKEILAALEAVAAEPPIQSTPAAELSDVYAPGTPEPVAPTQEPRELRLVDAISDGLREAMERDDRLVLMGQDIAEYGGVFKITEGFVEAFGTERVRNTPLCESAIIGIGLGLAIAGYRSMVEMQFADFVSCGFNQIVNNLAKVHYRWGQPASTVIRLPTGGGVGAGPYHSQSTEAWFYHVPGLKIVYPSNPHDAKGLLLAALADPNPVLYFEHKALYRKLSGPVPAGYYTEPIGQAARVRAGSELSVVTYGMGVHWAQEAVAELGIDADIIDLRSLAPLDFATVVETVRRTGRLLVLHEDTLSGGIGADIAAYVGEHAFEWLDAPVVRIAALDTPVPFAANLEADFLPQQRLRTALRRLADY